MTGTRLLFIAANPSIDRLYELDELTVGGIHRPASTTTVPGGKGLNAARAAAAVGGDVTAVALLGGRSGDWIAERLADLSVDVRAIRVAAETRTCVSILDRSTGALTEVYEPGATIEPVDWEAFEATIATELRHGDVAAVALSGSLPPGAPSDGFGRIARLAGRAMPPVAVLVDTYGSALAAALAERPALVKVNATEAGEATGVAVTDAISAAAAAGVLHDAGAATVIVTLGVDGAVVVGVEGRFRLVAPLLVGRYPVGSGDAFLGGLAVAVARGDGAVDAARLGSAAGIANAQMPGAGQLDASRVPAIVGAITVEPI